MKHVIVTVIYILAWIVPCYSDGNFGNILPPRVLFGEHMVAIYPYNVTDPANIAARIRIYDPTVAVTTTFLATSTVVHDSLLGNILRIDWASSHFLDYVESGGTWNAGDPKKSVPIILAVTHSAWARADVFTSILEAPSIIRETTMYYLISSISRDATWTVSDPIIRSSSAYYESLLVEEFQNELGEHNSHLHVVIYDQSTAIDNYFQKAWHFYVNTWAEVKAVMARAVPDGSLARYTTQQ